LWRFADGGTALRRPEIRPSETVNGFVCSRLFHSLMSLGQEVQICALVCDERALFEYETLQSGHEWSN
jgi:hypothetical protein